jgi:hypothetical protein
MTNTMRIWGERRQERPRVGPLARWLCPPVPIRGCFRWHVPTEIPACWPKRSPCEGRSSRAGEWGEGVISPLPHLHPPPHCHVPNIWSQREFPPLAPSRPPRWHSKSTSFASVPAAIRYWDGWLPVSPHPQVGYPRGALRAYLRSYIRTRMH